VTDLIEKILSVGTIFEDDTPEKPSVIFGHPSSEEWVDIFLTAKMLANTRAADPVRVEDRLPETTDAILVYSQSRKSWCRGRLVELNVNRFFVEGYLDDRVTHWQPMPPAP